MKQVFSGKHHLVERREYLKTESSFAQIVTSMKSFSVGCAGICVAMMAESGASFVFQGSLPTNEISLFHVRSQPSMTCGKTKPIFPVEKKWTFRRKYCAVGSLFASSEDDDDIIDVVIEQSANENNVDLDEPSGALVQSNDDDEPRTRKRDYLRNTIKKLASLSLEDYKWRSSVFKKNEADRRVEESLARMMGEDPAYVRPMDAGDQKLGPLGKAEKETVEWLSKVIEEEGKRAKRIANSDGILVRPMDLDRDGGPLADLEKQAVEFVQRIVDSEKERARAGIVRPKDMDEKDRGPLGNAETSVVKVLKNIKDSEILRAQQSKIRGGEIVRPIDVPGILGEFERNVMEVIRAEKQRAKDKEMNDGRSVRPKDASLTGPFGEAERRATAALDLVRAEEAERLKNVRRTLVEKRPMESDRDSIWGVTEAVTVGLLRGPELFKSVVSRVKELLQSEELEEEDLEIIREQLKIEPAAPESNAENEKPLS